MSTWRCRYRDTSLGGWLPWRYEQDLTGETYVCTRFGDADNPPEAPRMTYVDPSLAGYGDSPSGPNAPRLDTYQDTATPGAEPEPKAKGAKSAKAASAGCCQPGEARCFLCWLKDNWIGLALLLLSLAAYLTRKK